MQLLEVYYKKIKEKGYQSDIIQEEALKFLQRVYDQITKNRKPKLKWFKKIKRYKVKPIKGVYFWGSVGRGKTFLVDLFFDEVDTEYKKRVHFNHFMKYVHQALAKYKGKKRPLNYVADDIACEIRLLCFDEFFVEDIADAMILGDLFKILFEKGIILVATSNVKPELLYSGGLQRESFLPAIDALLNHVEVFNLDNGIDYRWRHMKTNKRFYYPLDGEKTFMSNYFNSITKSDALTSTSFILNSRSIKTIKQSDSAIWFDFSILCGHARGVTDYIDIAGHFDTVFISNIPILTEEYEDESRRFIALVDEFYDRKVLLIISAQVAMKELYQGSRLTFEFQRTLSRLNEMQADEFIDQVIER
jgi:cell division protein ZapE